MSSQSIPGEQGYRSGAHSFLEGMLPQEAVALRFRRVLEILASRYGEAVTTALAEETVDPDRSPRDLPASVRSPRAEEADSSWLKRTNMVGINIRTLGDYGGVIKYALTLPAALDSIHLLPIWEPGVVKSLYGIASWNLNDEFFSDEMYELFPHLDSVGKQLRATTNLLHVMGKTVGMDVIPHTDRYSEAAVGTPDLFEWMRVIGNEIVDHSDGLVAAVEAEVFRWLVAAGSASDSLPAPPDHTTLFASPEAERLAVLFGDPSDLFGRIERRVDLIRHLKKEGLEPVPATMGVPFRGLEVDPTNIVVDHHGMSWTDYRLTDPGPMGRVFSPLARFKLYERLDDNANWEIDFSRPRRHVWDYIRRHYAETNEIGNFDFMRGDMSHVQMRPDGVPDRLDEHYDILAAVKTHIQDVADAPWFGYFAESFLPPRDVFQFGEELDHLEASLADATLGDLQSTVVGSDQFLRRFRRYLDDLTTRRCAPAFCIGTSDKDDPRFDEFYRAGNEARLFTALFLTDMPSYTSLGFEIRDVHLEPVENERYTKLFVFEEEGDSNIYPSKARMSDSYLWGDNEQLFRRVTRLRGYAESVLREIEGATTRWLIPPDATGTRGLAAWTQETGRHVFMVNYDLEDDSGFFGLPGLDSLTRLDEEFSTEGDSDEARPPVRSNGYFHRIENLAPGEGRVYRINRAAD